MRKVLIIKLGYSETADAEISRVSSLGDVLRTTVILHKFKDDAVTWVTDENAAPLLIGNPYIKRILLWDVAAYSQLYHERFDIVVNLEKVPGLCALATHIYLESAKCRLYGFGFNNSMGEAYPLRYAEGIFDLANSVKLKKLNNKPWQNLLYSIIGEEWYNEEYILGYPAKKMSYSYDVGLNYQVGSKWPTKQWPRKNWEYLKWSLTSNGLLVGMQPDKTNLYDYMDWINYCNCLVTCDSLGLHIALALKKKVVVLCGPTHAGEIYLYNRGIIIQPSISAPCMPCFKPECDVTSIGPCMDTITVKQVVEAIKKMEVCYG